MPVLLPTDLLLFLLIALAAAFFLYARRHPHLAEPWQRVLQSRRGLCTLIVLVAYLAVALLDSLHFRPPLPSTAGHAPQYSPEVLSVFDALAAPLRLRVEKTYSAPLAIQAYVKETVTLPGGREARDYPRLDHAGRHLDAGLTVADDIARTLLRVAALTLAILGVSALLLAWMNARQAGGFRAALTQLLRGETAIPWRAGLATLGALVFLIALAADLAVSYHLFGTDKVGQDVFYQALKSIRTGLLIGTLTTLVMLPFALTLGLVAGYFRGRADDVIQYLYTTLNSIPGVLLIAAAVLMLQVYMGNHPEGFDTVALRADWRLLFLCLILGITSWTGLCRLLRGEALKLRELEYVQAAQAFGVRHARILTRHLLPNVMHIVLISIVLDFSGLVLAEAVLSYVGVGVDPATQSWGNMINAARLELAREPVVWWPLAAAFLFMFVLVLAANLFADVVRDALDPRLKGAG
jgi:peptide/nickel transport system permease protein